MGGQVRYNQNMNDRVHARFLSPALRTQLLLILILVLWSIPAAEASNDDGICFALSEEGPAICPTEEAKQVSVIRPIGLPAQEIEPAEYESWLDDESINTPDVYAWVDDYSPLYRHPAEAAAGLPPVRVSQPGFTYVSLVGDTRFEDEHWYLVNENSPRNPERADEYVHERNIHLVRPSTFPGVLLTSQPPVPFAWILRNVRPSSYPGGLSDPELPMLYRYDRVNIYGAERIDGWVWYLIDSNQWIKQGYVGMVTVDSPPAGVESGEKWIEVDLYEQTLAAYEGDRMVYATLVSTGLPQWGTRRGLFYIHPKVLVAKMSGRGGRSDYYYLEDIPWTMYFDWDIGLHAAYWHDSFGYRHSHGCVNLPPISAQWLYQWTTPYVPEGINRYSGVGTWVWVH